MTFYILGNWRWNCALVCPWCFQSWATSQQRNRKCLARTTLTVQLKTADEFLSRSQSEAIRGCIYFSLEDTFFPRHRTDGPGCGVLNSWLDALRKMNGSSSKRTSLVYGWPICNRRDLGWTSICYLSFRHKDAAKLSAHAGSCAEIGSGWSWKRRTANSRFLPWVTTSIIS